MYLQRGKWPIFFRRYRVEAFFVKAGSEYNCAVQSLEFCQTSTLMDGLLLRTTEAWKSIYLPVFAFDIQISRRLICLV